MLTAKQVAGGLKDGLHLDARGLYLQVTGKARSWVYRYQLDGKSRTMGLGSAEFVTLAAARDLAAEARKLARTGTDPIEARNRAREAAKAAATANTFREVAAAYIAAHGAAWRNAKHRQQWANTLATYAFPVIGDMGVAAIGTDQVKAILKSLWEAKPETASRLRGRIEQVLDYAAVLHWRTGENPARWKGHLAKLLPPRGKLARVQHHPALPWKDVAGFMADLARQEGMGALALRFAILTAARTGEVTGARWTEIDLQAALWTVPGVRMKAGQEHRVPLSEPAMALLRELQKAGPAPDGFVFPGSRPKRGLSSASLSAVLRRMGREGLTVHGFRSSFRDWAAEATNHPRKLAEAALAHTLRDKTEAAYRRGDLLEKRRGLMAGWAAQCAPTPRLPGRSRSLRHDRTDPCFSRYARCH